MSQDINSLDIRNQEGLSELQALLNAEWTELQQNEAITMREKMGSLEAQVSTSLQQDDLETDIDCEGLSITSTAPSNIVTYVNQKQRIYYWTVKLLKQKKRKQLNPDENEDDDDDDDDDEEEDAEKKPKVQPTAPTITDEIWQVDD